MKCPHCLVDYHDSFAKITNSQDKDGFWEIYIDTCPSCERIILKLRHINAFGERKDTLIRPKGIPRAPCPKIVPDDVAVDYKEACLVFDDSPKASAALSRRCLQTLLRNHGKSIKKDLADQIQEILDSGKLPSYLAENIDGIRNIGNFAAHPLKSTASGEIAEVEPGEAEYCLDTIELLFDFYFVQPDIAKTKRAALDAKLKDLGKPAMKQP